MDEPWAKATDAGETGEPHPVRRGRDRLERLDAKESKMARTRDANGTSAPDEVPDVSLIAETRVYYPPKSAMNSTLMALQRDNLGFQAIRSELATRTTRIFQEDEASVFSFTTQDTSNLGEPLRAFNIAADFGANETSTFSIWGVTANGVSGRSGQPPVLAIGEIWQGMEVPLAGIQRPEDIKAIVLANASGELVTPEAGTLFDRFNVCMKAGCYGTCLESLVTCVGAFAAYLACVVTACGGCALKCGACAACDCAPWCSWGAGCCRP
jgi:hypothetical protein